MPYSAETLMRGLNQSLSYSSSCVSEFFDAREYNTDRDGPSESSSEDDEDDFDEETEDTEEKDAEEDDFESDYYDEHEEQEMHDAHELASSSATSAASATSASPSSQALSPSSSATLTQKFTGRRQKLPVPKTDTEGLNLWNLLCKNIGKDLSKVGWFMSESNVLDVHGR
jgi:hypothetical protein